MQRDRPPSGVLQSIHEEDVADDRLMDVTTGLPLGIVLIDGPSGHPRGEGQEAHEDLDAGRRYSSGSANWAHE